MRQCGGMARGPLCAAPAVRCTAEFTTTAYQGTESAAATCVGQGAAGSGLPPPGIPLLAWLARKRDTAHNAMPLCLAGLAPSRSVPPTCPASRPWIRLLPTVSRSLAAAAMQASARSAAGHRGAASWLPALRRWLGCFILSNCPLGPCNSSERCLGLRPITLASCLCWTAQSPPRAFSSTPTTPVPHTPPPLLLQAHPPPRYSTSTPPASQ